MELKSYIAIFHRRLNLFLAVVLLFLCGGAAFKLWMPVRYEARLNLNVTREGIQKTSDYRYDGFYRLQADERFADTVVRWLETEKIQSEIIREAGLKKGSTEFKIEARRLSSQFIDVRVRSADRGAAKKLALGIAPALNAETEKLDRIQQEENWFLILGDDPVVSEILIRWETAVAVSLLLGLFFAFWAVLIRDYLEDRPREQSVSKASTGAETVRQ